MEQRLHQIEDRLSGLEDEIESQGRAMAVSNAQFLEKLNSQNTQIKIWLSMASIFGLVASIYFNSTLTKIDENMVTTASLTTALTILTSSVNTHVSDPQKHQNNTGRVDDNLSQIRDIGKDTVQLRVELEKLRAEAQRQ